VPSPPSIVSAPVAPFRKSDPAPPSSTLLAVLPVRLSLKPLPIRFSMLISVSAPGTAGGLRPGGRQTDGDAGVAKA
jgi:hypothetical protein